MCFIKNKVDNTKFLVCFSLDVSRLGMIFYCTSVFLISCVKSMLYFVVDVILDMKIYHRHSVVYSRQVMLT